MEHLGYFWDIMLPKTPQRITNASQRAPYTPLGVYSFLLGVYSFVLGVLWGCCDEKKKHWLYKESGAFKAGPRERMPDAGRFDMATGEGLLRGF